MLSLDDVIGAHGAPIAWWQMVLRAVLVFCVLLALIRIGDRRALARISAFDVVVGMMLGSTLSRALTGNAPFVPALAASAALVVMHALVARLALRWSWISTALKGRKIQLVEDGRMLRAAMRRTCITEGDLAEVVRTKGSQAGLDGIKAAYLERSGEISIVR